MKANNYNAPNNETDLADYEVEAYDIREVEDCLGLEVESIEMDYQN